jgi:hypothetical protein
MIFHDNWYAALSMNDQLALQSEFNFDDWNELSSEQKKIIYQEATGKDPDIYEPD